MSLLKDIALPLSLQLGSSFLTRSLHNEQIHMTLDQHKEALDIEEEHHKEALQESRILFHKDNMFAKQSHLMSTIVDIELALVSLDADMSSSAKEAERDQFDQRNNQLQTVIISSSVMISGLLTLLIQGQFPGAAQGQQIPAIPQSLDYLRGNDEFNNRQGNGLLLAYAFFCALSFSCLFLAIILCIETGNIVSNYMFARASFDRKVALSRRVEAQEFIEKLHYHPGKDLGAILVNSCGRSKGSDKVKMHFSLFYLKIRYCIVPYLIYTPPDQWHIQKDKKLPYAFARDEQVL